MRTHRARRNFWKSTEGLHIISDILRGGVTINEAAYRNRLTEKAVMEALSKYRRGIYRFRDHTPPIRRRVTQPDPELVIRVIIERREEEVAQ